jgi:hypothetical protein
VDASPLVRPTARAKHEPPTRRFAHCTLQRSFNASRFACTQLGRAVIPTNYRKALAKHPTLHLSDKPFRIRDLPLVAHRSYDEPYFIRSENLAVVVDTGDCFDWDGLNVVSSYDASPCSYEPIRQNLHGSVPSIFANLIDAVFRTFSHHWHTRGKTVGQRLALDRLEVGALDLDGLCGWGVERCRVICPSRSIPKSKLRRRAWVCVPTGWW